jgi:hypothetical protein
MSDIEYKDSAEFKALDGQSPPSQELLDGIFKNARFDTRFYTEAQSYSNPNSPSPGPSTFLISAALEPPPDAVSDFDTWYRQEHLDVLSRAPGFVRTRRYELVFGTQVQKFQSTWHYMSLRARSCRGKNYRSAQRRSGRRGLWETWRRVRLDGIRVRGCMRRASRVWLESRAVAVHSVGVMRYIADSCYGFRGSHCLQWHVDS